MGWRCGSGMEVGGAGVAVEGCAVMKGVLKNDVVAYGATLRGAGVYVQYGAVECEVVTYGAA